MKILWLLKQMLYLALTLFTTFIVVIALVQIEIIDYIMTQQINNLERRVGTISIAFVALLWSIWYFYYLN